MMFSPRLVFNTLSVVALITSANAITSKAHAMGRGRSTVPTVTPTPVPTTNTNPPVPLLGAPTCVSNDTNHLCIGLKLVSYTQNGISILTEAQAITLISGINSVWSQCNIGFQLETFESVDPASVNLSYDTNWKNDGDTVRSTFNDNSSFLVVTVGTLSGSTIGVTEMPGAGVYGSLIESAYAQNFLTVGHELGHYQGLYHISDNANLMNPYIGSNTSALTAAQCTTARAVDSANWQAMLRY